jgi:hypothetical protein
MDLEVRRNEPTIRSTTGKLAIDGQPQCVTLEPPPVLDPDGNGYVCITAGTYMLTIRWSPKNNRQVPHVESVPGRTEIELHPGNYPKDTDGCCLVGKDYGSPLVPDYVSLSDVTFNALMVKLYAGSVLTNPTVPEQAQTWNVGTITYVDFQAP